MAGVGTPRRLSYAALAAGIGGIVLIVSLFLDWFSSGGFGLSGWKSLKFTDIVLLVLGLLAIGYALIELVGAAVRLPFRREYALTVIGIVATTLTLEILIEGSNRAFGLWLATISSIAILIAGILAERRPELAVSLGGGPRAAYGTPPAQQMQPGVGGFAAAPPPGQQPPPQQPAAGATSVGTPVPPPQPQPPAQPAGPPPPPGGAADWYPDPHGQKRLRYYDGTQWTEHTAD
jgi:hypothetical protein